MPSRILAAYFVVTGAWAILHRASFEAVAGRKQDYWLVRTVGLLVLALGAGMLRAHAEDARGARSMLRLAAIGLGVSDCWHVARGVIRPVYLLDAAVEFAAVVGTLLEDRRAA